MSSAAAPTAGSTPCCWRSPPSGTASKVGTGRRSASGRRWGQDQPPPRARAAWPVGHSDRVLPPLTRKDTDENGEEVEERFFVLRSYTVFNLDQVAGPR